MAVEPSGDREDFDVAVRPLGDSSRFSATGVEPSASFESVVSEALLINDGGMLKVRNPAMTN